MKRIWDELQESQEIFEIATPDLMFRIGLTEIEFEFESRKKKLSVADFNAPSTWQVLVNAYETYQSVNIKMW